MTVKKRFKVGSKLIERGKVYRIYKIGEKKVNGKTERVIYYRPYYADSTNSTIICSVPESSLTDINVRKPVSKKEVDKLLGTLSKKVRNGDVFDTVEAKETLNLNDIYQSAKVLKRCWREKSKNAESFTKAKKDILKTAIDRIVEEIALVSRMPLSKAKDKIMLALGK